MAESVACQNLTTFFRYAVRAFFSQCNISVPISVAGQMIEHCSHYFSLFNDWTSEITQKLPSSLLPVFHPSMIYDSEPRVVLASPGMLNGGQSLEIFREWCKDERNLVVIPGHCINGTLGARLLGNGGKPQQIQMPNGKMLEVRSRTVTMPLSAHADCEGICSLLQRVGARRIVLVHGNAGHIQKCSAHLQRVDPEFQCVIPRNGEEVIYLESDLAMSSKQRAEKIEDDEAFEMIGTNVATSTTLETIMGYQ
jgi:integrator complex subunit 11